MSFKTSVPTWGEVRVYFRHHNPQKPDFAKGLIPGTECFIVTDKDDPLEVSHGETELCSRDIYCKETGRKLALTRAIRNLERSERVQIWDAYFKSRGISYERS